MKKSYLKSHGLSWIDAVLVLSFLTVLALGAINLYLYYYKRQNPKSSQNVSTTATAKIVQPPPVSSTPPTPAPYKIPGGLQTYRFSNGSEVKGPKIAIVTIDPLDPAKGANQSISVDLESDSPVTSSSMIVMTDNNKKTVELKLTSGDTQKGTYQGSWQVNDSYEKTYSFRFIIKSANGTYDNVMNIR